MTKTETSPITLTAHAVTHYVSPAPPFKPLCGARANARRTSVEHLVTCSKCTARMQPIDAGFNLSENSEIGEKVNNKRQQVFTLIIEHTSTHKEICERILGLVNQATGVSRAGIFVSGTKGETVVKELDASYPVLAAH